MTREFEINPNWDPEIKSVCMRFNKYARRHSLKLVSESIDSLIVLLQSNSDRVRHDAAEALFCIKSGNPGLISDYANNLMGNILDRDNRSNLSINGFNGLDNGANPNDANKNAYISIDFSQSENAIRDSLEDYSLNENLKQYQNKSDQDHTGFESIETEDEDPKIISIEDNGFSNGKSDDPIITPSYPQENRPNDNTHQKNANTLEYANIRENTKNQEFINKWENKYIREDSMADNQTNLSVENKEIMMSLSVKELKIKNIRKVKNNGAIQSRKCALGDGIFKGYDGVVYKCTCGTLYHENCLKIQAIFTGHCLICDREFIKPD